MSRLGEKRLEERDDFLLHKVDEALERWENRLTLRRPTIRERYMKGELSIHIYATNQIDSETPPC